MEKVVIGDATLYHADCLEILPMLETGIHHGITEEHYHSLPYISSTQLKKYRNNPADCLIPFEPTEDMLIGSGIHCHSLQGSDEFNRQFAVLFTSDLNKNTKEYKSQKEVFETLNIGKHVLPAAYKKTPTMEVLQGVDRSLRSHPVARQFFKQGFQEVTLIWDCPETGKRCKARLDWNPGQRCIADLKKTASVEKFHRQMVDLSYDIQAGHYTNGANALGLDVDTFIFISVEAEEPYPVRCGYLSSEWLQWARVEATRLSRLYSESLEANIWPAYKLPEHYQSLSDINAADLLEEWSMPSWR